MDWVGVKSGSLQHRALIALEAQGGRGRTAEVAKVLFGSEDFKFRSRARSVLQALENKEIILRVGPSSWEVQASATTATNAELLRQLRLLQDRVGWLEAEVERLK